MIAFILNIEIKFYFISTGEFSKPEKENKLGVLLWPYWNYNVLLLNGQNLAMNHLIATKQMNIIKLEKLLDIPSYNSNNIFRVPDTIILSFRRSFARSFPNIFTKNTPTHFFFIMSVCLSHA